MLELKYDGHCKTRLAIAVAYEALLLFIVLEGLVEQTCDCEFQLRSEKRQRINDNIFNRRCMHRKQNRPVERGTGQLTSVVKHFL